MSLTFHAALAERDYDVGFAVGADETVAVLGPNGAGKSTTIDLLAGLLVPDSGSATWDDEVLFRIGSAGGRVWTPPHERRVALVPQEGLLFPHLNARDNAGFAVRARGGSRREARRAGEKWLGEVGARDWADRTPRTLSGGQRQRVAVARALASDPRLLLLDEPLASLDAGGVPALRELLLGVLRGRAAVLVTHDPHDALALAQRVVVIEAGRVVQQGLTRDVLRNPSTEYLRQLTLGLRD